MVPMVLILPVKGKYIFLIFIYEVPGEELKTRN
jgi:hypothetical protein